MFSSFYFLFYYLFISIISNLYIIPNILIHYHYQKVNLKYNEFSIFLSGLNATLVGNVVAVIKVNYVCGSQGN